jgi:hypothetical protein
MHIDKKYNALLHKVANAQAMVDVKAPDKEQRTEIRKERNTLVDDMHTIRSAVLTALTACSTSKNNEGTLHLRRIQ